MGVWDRNGYMVVEKEFDYNLHQFDVIQGNTVIATITPPDIESMNAIIEALDAGEEVNGWEDGMGNVITIEEDVH